MVLFLHNRYRTVGGEERAVENLLWLVREQLGEPAELFERDSALLGRGAAAAGMLGGGLEPDEVGRAVRRTGARVVHAHNINPAFGWRALAAARAAGARVVLHLHQYRLVCAVGVCFTRGETCTRCHGRNTLPGVVRGCRGTGVEALVYGAGLALWQRRLAAQVDAFVVPSRFALERLRALGAPLGETHVVGHVVREFADPDGGSPAPGDQAGLPGAGGRAGLPGAGGRAGLPAPDDQAGLPAPGDRAGLPGWARARAGGYALFVGRLAGEKGAAVAIEAAGRAGVELVVAGDGPLRGELARLAESVRAPGDPGVRFVGRVTEAALAELRAGACVGLVPSLSGETFGLAAAEAMACGLPVVASRIGALPELVTDEGLVPPGDAVAMAAAIGRLRADPAAGGRALERARRLVSPEAVAPALAAAYA